MIFSGRGLGFGRVGIIIISWCCLCIYIYLIFGSENKREGFFLSSESVFVDAQTEREGMNASILNGGGGALNEVREREKK